MLTGLSWLALEVKYLERARPFYEETLGLTLEGETDSELRFRSGPTDLVLRRPDSVPRGGLHTHYAFSIPSEEYDDWWEQLSENHDLEEAQFGPSRSLYLYDPDGNCVELGQQSVDGPGIDGIFEVVLEVDDLERSADLYGELGFETVDVGDDRKRIRMDGPMALELWEPHLGIADARGGVHVDLGFETDDLDALCEVVEDRVCSLERASETTAIVRDPDGHVLTLTDS
ncbi:Glyoxalase-like domain-containing protein [Natronorubrum sediminis]|uniref:Glyoxalase-like domain-containing protein n=1 Tax=Natronorubrum sediminis TaxID=640943 RepID=A0A1H6FZ45_9EURY|nr:VOC family protein [Natronorubrum sediminis]SEH16066.1 Glyoxalase-like domain-containing protein [Natronorubrum sediminis]